MAKTTIKKHLNIGPICPIRPISPILAPKKPTAHRHNNQGQFAVFPSTKSIREESSPGDIADQSGGFRFQFFGASTYAFRPREITLVAKQCFGPSAELGDFGSSLGS